MSTEVRVLRGDVIHGPFSREQVLGLLDKGKITQTDMVSVQNGPWVRVSEYLGDSASTKIQPIKPPVNLAGPPSPRILPPKPAPHADPVIPDFAFDASDPAPTEPPLQVDEEPTPHSPQDENPLQSKFKKMSSSRKLLLIGGVAGGVLFFGCSGICIVGMIVGDSTKTDKPSGSSLSEDCLKADGTAPTLDEEKKHEGTFGPKPDYSRWDGSFKEVQDYLEISLNDPKSVEYVFWSKVLMTDNGWDIRLTYRAKNPFGALILKDQVFTVRNGAVVGVRNR